MLLVLMAQTIHWRIDIFRLNAEFLQRATQLHVLWLFYRHVNVAQHARILRLVKFRV